MAKNDYHVIVYQILSYLYKCLKDGEQIHAKNLMYNGSLFQINKNYWMYILENLVADGYITGLREIRTGDGCYIEEQLPYVQITPRGIEFLCDNSFIEKAKDFFKDTKDIVPFI